MSLPGKLCVGILEEDIPQKSYFRFKPLLIEADGRYVPFESAGIYSEEGCLRIVPDKNESSHFKARMRRIGLFSVVDLTGHPGENDKIRPNKNYRGDEEERNAFIIYSDVVREPAPGMIYQVLDQAEEIVSPAPHTPMVLVWQDGGLSASPYACEVIEEEAEEARSRARLVRSEERCAVSEMQMFDLAGFREERLSFAILPPGRMAQISDLPPEKVEKAAEKPLEKTLGSDAVLPENAPEAEKPWISHDASIEPKPLDPRLSPLQRVLAAQVGLNPRRGRSLQELIEEKWQHSRINQLGQPIAPISTGAPVFSPVEAAVAAVDAAWKNPDMRAPLLKSLSAIEEFGVSMRECREILRKSAIEERLNELEARRLSLLGEIEQLRAGRDAVRDQLKQEIRRDEAADFADAVRKTEEARAVQARFERQAEEARSAARDAQAACEALENGALESRLKEFAFNSHVLEYIDRMPRRRQSAAAPAVDTQADMEALVNRVRTRFIAAGWALSDLTAANLCVCALVSPMLIFSGPVGSGKTAAARLLAEALGWMDAGRYAAFAPGTDALEGSERISALGEAADTPAMVLLDDANLSEGGDLLRGLGALLDRPEWRMCMTVQDAGTGRSVSAHILDRGFMIRLAMPASDAPWEPMRRQAPELAAPISLRAVREALLPEAALAVTADLRDRMHALRQDLGKYGASISRRALDDTWNYCGLMMASQGASASEAFDMAIAQRVLPALLAAAPLALLAHLPQMLSEMPACRALLSQPLPIDI